MEAVAAAGGEGEGFAAAVLDAEEEDGLVVKLDGAGIEDRGDVGQVGGAGRHVLAGDHRIGGMALHRFLP
ncbi:MAG: hypothetical protein BWY77_01771 [bacterium ADurb.Bin431]|nr:MAG: hypothetical protein BWY77_01771 [bacterium ADurb.Bin431]